MCQSRPRAPCSAFLCALSAVGKGVGDAHSAVDKPVALCRLRIRAAQDNGSAPLEQSATTSHQPLTRSTQRGAVLRPAPSLNGAVSVTGSEAGPLPYPQDTVATGAPEPPRLRSVWNWVQLRRDPPEAAAEDDSHALRDTDLERFDMLEAMLDREAQAGAGEALAGAVLDERAIAGMHAAAVSLSAAMCAPDGGGAGL